VRAKVTGHPEKKSWGLNLLKAFPKLGVWARQQRQRCTLWGRREKTNRRGKLKEKERVPLRRTLVDLERLPEKKDGRYENMSPEGRLFMSEEDATIAVKRQMSQCPGNAELSWIMIICLLEQRAEKRHRTVARVFPKGL